MSDFSRKNLKTFASEQDQVIEAARQKKRQANLVLKKFPDAVLTVLENGQTTYLTKEISNSTKGAVPQIFSTGDRAIIRYMVKIGSILIYSTRFWYVSKYQILQLVQSFINTQTGRKTEVFREITK